MKIQRVTTENEEKAFGLLRQTFSANDPRVRLIENLHAKKRKILEWIALHKNKAIGYIGFTNAYNKEELFGFHLTLLAVNPSFQNQGIGTEIMRFALRQKELKDRNIFVLGGKIYFSRFNFKLCTHCTSPLASKKNQLSCLGSCLEEEIVLGYEPEFLKNK